MLFQWVDHAWGVYFLGIISGLVLAAILRVGK